MRILVIQMARFGDVLQSLPTLAGLKTRYPGCQIDFIVRESLVEAAELSPDVDRLVAFPAETILAPLLNNPQSPAPQERITALAQLITWVADHILEETHRHGPYDLTLNLTFSESSSFLCEIIPSKERRGLKRAPDGVYAVTDAWSHYVYSQVLRRNMNILHLNDLFARIAGVAAAAVSVTTKGFDGSHDLGKLVIGLHLGATSSDKTLNPKVWASLAQGVLLALPEAQLVLFGSKDDRKRAGAVIASLDAETQARCTSLVGRLRFAESIHWLKRCHFMITPDTYMVQLAPLCEIKTINIALGSIRSPEIGPYGAGHHVMRPLDNSFSEGMKPLVEAIVCAIMSDSIPAGVPTLQTKMTTCSDGTLRNELVPLNFERDEIVNFFEQAYYLLGEFRNSGRYEDLTIPPIGSPSQSDRLQLLINSYDALCATRRLGLFGQECCVQMLENNTDREKLQALGNRITEIETMLRTLQQSVSFVKPLIDSWEIAKENVIGDRIEDLASLTEATFRELVQNIEMVQQLLQVAVDAARERIGQNQWTEITNEMKLRESEHENNIC